MIYSVSDPYTEKIMQKLRYFVRYPSIMHKGDIHPSRKKITQKVNQYIITPKSMTYRDTVYLKMYSLAMHLFFGGKVNKYVSKREVFAFKYLFMDLTVTN